MNKTELTYALIDYILSSNNEYEDFVEQHGTDVFNNDGELIISELTSDMKSHVYAIAHMLLFKLDEDEE